MAWNNFAKALWWWLVHYLYAQGEVLTSTTSRQIQNFVFYGMYNYRGKKYPVVHSLHRSLSCGRHRFSPAKHQLTFDWFEQQVEDNGWADFLDDKGEGNAPKAYLAVVEKLLRELAKTQEVSMGSGCMGSRKSWGDPARLWRKREVCFPI